MLVILAAGAAVAARRCRVQWGPGARVATLASAFS